MTMRLLFSACAVSALAACGPANTGEPNATGSEVRSASCTGRAYAEIGGPFNLIDQDGNAVTEANYQDRPNMIYFGFAYCPDVCPATLATLERAYRRLPEDMAPPRTILISVDSERDTPDVLKSYVASNGFPDDIVGLTGSEAQIRAAADAFLTDYTRVELPESAAGYTMDHQSIVYLMDEDWQLKTFFTHEATDADIAACLEEQLG